MQKRDTLRRTLEEGKEKETHHPTINRKASGKKKQQDKSVFERLYGLREKENEEDNC